MNATVPSPTPPPPPVNPPQPNPELLHTFRSGLLGIIEAVYALMPGDGTVEAPWTRNMFRIGEAVGGLCQLDFGYGYFEPGKVMVWQKYESKDEPVGTIMEPAAAVDAFLTTYKYK